MLWLFMKRRQFLHTAAGAALTSCSTLREPDSLIIDTHQHLWERKKVSPPWLAGAPEVLRHDFTNADYMQAFAGLNVKAIYMEVDVAPEDHVKRRPSRRRLVGGHRHLSLKSISRVTQEMGS